MAPLSQLHIGILLNGPQDARPGKFSFAYAQSPAKRTHSRESPGTGQNLQELGRIHILLPRAAGVPSPPLKSPRVLAGRPPPPSAGGELEPGLALHTLHRTPLVGRLGLPAGAGGCLPNRHGVGGFTTKLIHSPHSTGKHPRSWFGFAPPRRVPWTKSRI